MAADGAFCEHQLIVQGNAHTTMSCEFADPIQNPGSSVDSDRIPPGQLIDVDFKNTSIHDVVRVIGEACKLSVVAPDSIDSKLTVRLKQAPCDQALEVILEANGLWYRYVKDGNMLLIAQRVTLDREADGRRQRAEQGIVDDPLPTGGDVDLDFKDAPLQDVLRLLADSAKVNIVVPDSVGGKITVYL